MKTNPLIAIATLAFFSCILAGCAEETATKEDVQSARQEYEEERDEAFEALEEAQEMVSREVAEARAAKDKLEQTKAEFASDQSRQAYVERQERRLADIRVTIAELKSKAARLEGEEKESLESKILKMDERFNEAQSQLTELKEGDIDDWIAQREEVDGEFRQLAEAVDAASKS